MQLDALVGNTPEPQWIRAGIIFDFIRDLGRTVLSQKYVRYDSEGFEGRTLKSEQCAPVHCVA